MDRTDPTRTDLRILATMSALLVVGILGARLTLAAMRAHTPAVVWTRESIGMRTQELAAHLPEIAAHPGPVALVLGSSLAEQGVSPAVVDAELARAGTPMTTFNLALGGSNPHVVRQLALRIREEFEQNHKQIEVLVLEVTPFQATLARSKGKAFGALAQARLAILTRVSELAAVATRSPEEASHLLAIKLLGDEVPNIATRIVTDRIYEPALWDAANQRNADWGMVWASAMTWDARGRGEHPTLTSPDAIASYEDFLRRKYTRDELERNRASRISSTDFVDLHFDPALVDDYIASAQILAPLARHTYVLLVPVNHPWAEPSAEGKQRLAAMVARVVTETHAELLDLSHAPQFEEADFLDTTHLNELRGRPKLSRLLGDVLAAQLSRGRSQP